VVGIWEEVAHRDPREIEASFARLLAADEESEAEPNRADLLKAIKKSLEDPAGLIAVPPQPEHAFSDQQLTEYRRRLDEARLLESRAADEPAAMGVTDGTVCTALPLHIRGSYRNLGDPVPREFPAVMRFSSTRPVFPSDQSGRLELARWMADSRHRLTARVYVNRLWRWHFGRGLVATTENFGALGARPSHPELLDWLARRLMESGWSTKTLQRLILSSHTYRMASLHPDAATAEAIDPENRWLWKFPRRRLEAEEIRDAILVVAGRLDRTMGGKTVPLRNRQFVFDHTSIDHTKYDSHRRAVYLPVIRNNLYEWFAQFDFPDPTTPTGNRAATTVAPQALLLLNDPLVIDAAQCFAENALRTCAQTRDRVEWIHRRALGRPPTSTEQQRAAEFLGKQPALRRWTLYCQALLASNEFCHAP
jgi:hypothetical protein